MASFEKGVNFNQLCKLYGISTKCGDKWKERFLSEGKAELLDKKRTPNNSPKKILELYKRTFPQIKPPDKSTLDRIFKKAGLTLPKKKKRVKHSVERISLQEKSTRPNQIWTVDFKGWWYTSDSEKVNPLTIRDDCSKYILSIYTLTKRDMPSVKAEFIRLFKIYGLPNIIRSDNGPPFASMQSLLGLTKLSVCWLSLGIKLDRIEPGKPYQKGLMKECIRTWLGNYNTRSLVTLHYIKSYSMENRI